MALLSGATSLVGLFLSLESFTLALYILVSFHRNHDPGAEAGLKYLVLGAVATGFMAFGIALIYAASGTFHLPEALQGLQAGSSSCAPGGCSAGGCCWWPSASRSPWSRSTSGPRTSTRAPRPR